MSSNIAKEKQKCRKRDPERLAEKSLVCNESWKRREGHLGPLSPGCACSHSHSSPLSARARMSTKMPRVQGVGLQIRVSQQVNLQIQGHGERRLTTRAEKPRIQPDGLATPTGAGGAEEPGGGAGGDGPWTRSAGCHWPSGPASQPCHTPSLALGLGSQPAPKKEEKLSYTSHMHPQPTAKLRRMAPNGHIQPAGVLFSQGRMTK